ncbi:E3 ubiquitin-protein ligase RNF103 isoform X3 [Peromyscus eremicus]|uniref:E3 ubiquitin-protein ligase RNF103 isoform X3 n=1 Tax=Peromyscus eremicus TaxID=42410 RepID=UPI0027DD6EA1|nr:E3 ubiquitin-protein ligase RNF103 isoform X3 [Peromyscus eremicus]
MWLKLFFLLLYFLVLFVLARFFEAIVWYETGIFATQLVDPVALSFKKLKTILECRGLGYSGLPEKKDVRELVEKSGDLMEGELYSALKEEEASESVSSTNFSGEMHFYELVEDTKDGIWLVQVIANDRSPLVGKIHWEKMVKKVSRFGIRTGTFNCSSDPRVLMALLHLAHSSSTKEMIPYNTCKHSTCQDSRRSMGLAGTLWPPVLKVNTSLDASHTSIVESEHLIGRFPHLHC